MKISLVVVGKAQDDYIKEYSTLYNDRIKRYSNFYIVETTDEKLEDMLEKYDRVYLLDEKGKEYASLAFADFVQKQMNSGVQKICFVIGGAFGFNDAIRQKSDGIISLSKLTFPHQLVRIIFLEQLYRAFSILANEKYHHQ